MNSAEFGQRMRGEGPFAEQIRNMFGLFTRKYGLDSTPPELDTTQFEPPNTDGQMRLF